jgi:riboflavin biosynthesis pyrimidine reductase
MTKAALPVSVSCASALRAMVFEMRARSDVVIVGGNTVRRDNPRLTTRREGGHTPARIVMSRTLDLPEVGKAGAGGRRGRAAGASGVGKGRSV